jgi:two-component system, NtrC family, sensor kinase
MDAFYKLPTLILLGALVLIFASVRRQNRTMRFRLWLYAWVMVFARLALFLWLREGRSYTDFVEGVDLTLLVLGALIFMISVSNISERPWARISVFLCVGGPFTAYAFTLAYFPQGHWLFAIYLAFAVLLGVPHTFYVHGPIPWSYSQSAFVLGVCAWSAYQAVTGRPDVGYYSLLSAIFVITAALFVRTYRRLSVGVITSILGFVAWAAVAVFAFNPVELSANSGNLEILNLPKFIVAIGMIVTLMEDERLSADFSRLAQWSINEQLRRFSDITYRLLTGWQVKENADEVAQVITDASNFERAVVVLTDDQRTMYLAGNHGYTPEELDNVREVVAQLSTESIALLCSEESRVGRNSFRVPIETLAAYGCKIRGRAYAENPFWRTGDHLLIPLLSPRNNYVGCIALQDARQLERVNTTELSPLEMLGADIAVAIENATLQQHLFRSEKLAGMGQLVAGVAHELNNPLTAVLGYTEMLQDRSPDESTTHDLSVIRRESLRMKVIIDKLQRFARQQRTENRAVDLTALVEEVLRLKRLDLHQQRVQVNLALNGLQAAADDVMLKQVLLNVISNAIDAVENSKERIIEISATSAGDKVQLSVRDSGPGFKDATRVFDPFYTTKSPGKGTGLGLSICYALVKDMGGDVSAFNTSPSGARITIVLPEATPVASPASTLA